MKRTFWTGILLVTVGIVCLVLWRQHKQDLVSHIKLQDIAGLTNTDNRSNTGVSPFSAGERKLTSAIGDLARAKEFQRELESKNVPLDFYGHFIDQNSNSLPGVRLHFVVRHWDAKRPESGYSIPIDKETDEQGKFEIHGITGDAIDMETVVKKGYELEPITQSFGPVGGNSINPITFRMWSNDVHERLITGTKHFKIVPDGRRYTLDLMYGMISDKDDSKGDLQIWLKRPDGVHLFQKYYEWSYGMEMEDGGILPEPNRSLPMYQAPFVGYTDGFNWTQPATNNGWGDNNGTQKFYIKIRGREFGKLTVTVDINFFGDIPGFQKGDAIFSISYSINPSGSALLR